MDLTELTIAELRRMGPQERSQALEEMVRVVNPSLVGRAFIVLHDQQMAEDVCQEAWMMLTRRLLSSFGGVALNGRPDPTGPIERWMHGVVYRIALNTLKKSSRRRKIVVEMAADILDGHEDQHAVSPGFAQDIEMALNELESRQREVFLMRYDESLSFEAIGARLGISARAARCLFFRARNKLQSVLTGRTT